MPRIARILPLLAAFPALAKAQSDTVAPVTPHFLRGVVMSRGAPVGGVNIFDRETLEGALTGPDGRFAILSPYSTRSRIRVVTRRIGYKPLDTLVAAGASDLVLTLSPLADLAAVTVQAGRYTASAERTATLTPIEVATTPGANANVNDAIKTLPGVQNADEGTGLFVRGGDYTETKIFVDGAPLHSPYQFQAPTGSVQGTINPFLLERITFSSGGFTSAWGNALSGVVDLRTQGRPQRAFASANASLAGYAVSAGIAPRPDFGVSATLALNDIGPIFALNGNVRGFAPVPRGTTASALAGWNPASLGEVKVFALRQDNRMGIPVNDPDLHGTYVAERTSDIAVATWRNLEAAWTPFVSVSTSGYTREDSKGVFNQQMRFRGIQARADVSREFDERLRLDLGAELERNTAKFDGAFPANPYAGAPGSPTTRSTLDVSGWRDAAYVSVSARPFRAVQVIAGARTDRSAFTGARTVDPRISLAWVIRPAVTLTAAWGRYHQTADPAFLERFEGAGALPPLAADQAIVGLQAGEAGAVIRVEGWSKGYHDLVSLTREYRTVGSLTGYAHGMDVFARVPLPRSLALRFTYSGAVSHRADPNTGLDAPAPFDVTHSVATVLQRTWGRGWSAAVAHRYASGRPFTDVLHAAYDSSAHVWIPTYGAPGEEHLPRFGRADATVSRARPLGRSGLLVVFASVNNVLNRTNVYGYTWTPDYAQRVAVRSYMNRSFFFGANIAWSKSP